jgi:hypothetical protein
MRKHDKRGRHGAYILKLYMRQLFCKYFSNNYKPRTAVFDAKTTTVKILSAREAWTRTHLNDYMYMYGRVHVPVAGQIIFIPVCSGLPVPRANQVFSSFLFLLGGLHCLLFLLRIDFLITCPLSFVLVITHTCYQNLSVRRLCTLRF